MNSFGNEAGSERGQLVRLDAEAELVRTSCPRSNRRRQ